MIHPLKVNMTTLRMEFKTGGLKNVDICFKFVSLQSSWVEKPYDHCFNEWKIIPLHLLKNILALALNSILTFILKVNF